MGIVQSTDARAGFRAKKMLGQGSEHRCWGRVRSKDADCWGTVRSKDAGRGFVAKQMVKDSEHTFLRRIHSKKDSWTGFRAKKMLGQDSEQKRRLDGVQSKKDALIGFRSKKMLGQGSEQKCLGRIKNKHARPELRAKIRE